MSELQLKWDGGAKLEEVLRKIEKQATEGGVLRVGFLEGRTYPDGTPVAYIASVQEYGGTANIPEHDITLYRSINEKTGEFNKQGRFVKKSKSNFSTTHRVKAHTITIPPRPFFRNAIEKNSKEWGATLAKIMAANGYNVQNGLTQMGEVIKGQIVESILDMKSPQLAASTVKKKGFDKPLIDTRVMIDSVDFEVK